MRTQGISLLGALLLLTPSAVLAQPDEQRTADRTPPETKPTVLITGFTPWGHRTENSSWEGAKRLHEETIEGHTVVAALLEVDYRKVWARVQELIKEHSPQAVVHFGLRGSLKGLQLELKARNQAFWTSDDSGYAPEDNRIAADGPMIYTSRLPEQKILEGMREAKERIETSENAGNFLCEYTFYTQLYFQDKLNQKACAGFVHVPPFRKSRPRVSPQSLATSMTRLIEIVLQDRKARAEATVTPTTVEDDPPPDAPGPEPTSTPPPVDPTGDVDGMTEKVDPDRDD